MTDGILDEITVTSTTIKADAVMAGDDFYDSLTSIRLSDGALVRNSDGKVMGYMPSESLKWLRNS